MKGIFLNFRSYEKEHGGCEVRQVNGMLHLMLGERTPQVNGQDQIVQSGNYSYSFIKVVSIDEIKIKPLKYHYDFYSNYISKLHCPSHR